LLVGLLLGSSALAQDGGCGPFAERYPVVQLAAADTGVAPASGGAAGDTIVSLPDPSAAVPETPGGQALVALPKASDGTIPTDFELAPEARIADSFFSSVLCATVVRVVGAAGATPRELVPGVPDTATVVPNSVYGTAQAEVTPAEPGARPDLPRPDPYRPLQYGVDQSGVELARSLSNGSGTRVAVLDSAPEAGHRDLAVVVEPLEGGPPAAPAVHGTMVAGIVAAIEGNGFGMAGLAPGTEVLAVPVCTPVGPASSDRCELYDLLRGVEVAWERESDVVNLSLVGPANPLLERGMARLDELGVLVVASSGNDGTSAPRYPAAYPSVIGVGAADRDRRIYARSNTGISSELLAPGVEVLSAVPGNTFAFSNGTSFSAAHVSGVLSVLIGAGLDPPTARAALFQQAHQAAEGGGAVLLPAACDVLARVGRDCNTP
jgi:hypothetical protein